MGPRYREPFPTPRLKRLLLPLRRAQAQAVNRGLPEETRGNHEGQAGLPEESNARKESEDEA